MNYVHIISESIQENIKFNNGLILEEPYIFEEPTFEFEFNGKKYPCWGNPAGHFKSTNYDLSKFFL